MELLKLLLYMLILNYAESIQSLILSIKPTVQMLQEDINFSPLRQMHLASEVDYTIDDRLPDFMIPDHYDIKLEQQDVKENKKFHGQCNISVRLIYPVSIIRLHAPKTHIQLNKIVFYKINSSESGIEPYKDTYNKENHIYQFKFEKELLNGYYTVYIAFDSVLDYYEENFYETEYKDIRGENK